MARVQLLLLDPSGKINNFVMRTIGRHHRDFIVPVDWVQEVDQENVRLSVEKEALERLDEYVTDLKLADEIDAAIWGKNAIKNALWMPYLCEFDSAVHDGMVRLQGHVPTSPDRLQVENAVNSIPGVLRIENRLVADYDLTIAVAQALSHDERTHLAMITVDTQIGIVSLSGHVESASNQCAAEEIAVSVPYSAVWGVAFSVDGPLVACGSLDGTVRLWETESGRLVTIIQSHTSGVWNLVLSDRGELLASSGADGTVRLWEVPSGKPLAALQGHSGGVRRSALTVAWWTSAGYFAGPDRWGMESSPLRQRRGVGQQLWGRNHAAVGNAQRAAPRDAGGPSAATSAWISLAWQA